MGRRKPGALFDAAGEAPQGSEEARADHGTAVPAVEGDAGDARAPGPSIGNLKVVKVTKPRSPEETARLKALKAERDHANADKTLREQAREIAGKDLRRLMKFFKDVANGTIKPTTQQMNANETLLEIAIDKTGAAQPVLSQRKRILAGQASAAVPGRRTGGDSVLKNTQQETVDASTEQVVNG